MPGTTPPVGSFWASGDGYERYVGRWSRPVARQFVALLPVPPGRRWLDVGCGTGALTETVLAQADPAAVVAVDPSPGFLRHAADRLRDRRAFLVQAVAQALPLADRSVDAAVSGLALNFVPEPGAGVAEMRRVTRPGGPVAAYVWDYPGRMELMSYFWDTAAELDPAAGSLREGLRFDSCRPDPLRELFASAGVREVDVEGVVVPTVFADFPDYWGPFEGRKDRRRPTWPRSTSNGEPRSGRRCGRACRPPPAAASR